MNTAARTTALAIAFLAAYSPLASAQSEPPPSANPATVAGAPSEFLRSLHEEAAALWPLVKTDAARAFLDAVPTLPTVAARTVLRTADRSAAYTVDEAALLPEAERAALKPRECDEAFYYCTGYGSPLLYARPLDVLGGAGVESFSGKRIFDFGYGMIGQGRLLAACGADYVGVEVEPLLRALYSRTEDQGPVSGEGGARGSLNLLHGRWPGELKPAASGQGAPFDLFITKNVLKAGYIHPARETDPRFLVNLGVDDETFVRAMHAALKPGGLALIYNISPAQAPADKPYIPWADGKCPFDRALLEKCSFEVLAFDQDDQERILDFWVAAGVEEGKTREQLKTELFAWYTLLRAK